MENLIISGFDSAMQVEGVWYVSAGESMLFSSLLAIFVVFQAFLGASIFYCSCKLINSLIRRFIFPGRSKTSGGDQE